MSQTTDFSATVSGVIRDRILVVTIDNAPVNATSADVRRGLEAALARAETAAEITGLQHRPENRNRFSESTMRRFKELERTLCVHTQYTTVRLRTG